MNFKRHFCSLFILYICLTWGKVSYAQTPDSVPSPQSPKHAVGFTSQHRFNLAPMILPVTMIATGFYYTYHTGLIDRYGVRDWRNEHYPEFHTKIDDYLQFVPAGAMYILDFAGVKATNDMRTQSIRLVESELLMGILTYSIKATTSIERPDGRATTAFPSGHTAQAFLGATMLHKEFGKGRPWISVAGYFVATSVGAIRVLNNKHWITDVIAGAGIGMLSAEIAYLPLFPAKKKQKNTKSPAHVATN